MAQRRTPDFGIGTVTVGRLDGTGEPVSVPFTPAATIRTQVLAERSEVARRSPGYAMAYFSLADSGRLPELGMTPPEDWRDARAVEDALLEFFAKFGLESGEGADEGDEPGPTTASE